MRRRIRELLQCVASFLAPVKPLLGTISQFECRIASAWARSAHRRLMLVQWGIPPQPDNFDHHIDLFYLWRQSRNPQWVERGVYSALCLRGGSVLDLCCGDGFNARNFYSLRSKSVVACDFDHLILKTARAKNHAPNVSFVQADIRTNLPGGIFDNIVWDAAIDYFKLDEVDTILKNIKSHLRSNGILSGLSTPVKSVEGQKRFSRHKYEFKDKEDLRRVFTPYFKNVYVFETSYQGRQNLYFWASDGPIPFSPEWTGACDNWGGEPAVAGDTSDDS